MSANTTRDSSLSRSPTDSDVEKGDIGPLPPSKQQSSLIRHLNAEISPVGVDALILLCWFTTGFLDSTIFNAYRTFVSMQTGNTIFIGLGAANNHVTTRPYGWLKSLSSLIAFLVGCYAFSRLAYYLGARRRLTFIISFLLQTALLFLAAILVQTNVVESRLEFIGEDIVFSHIIPIVLLSLQAPGQTCMGRQVSMPEVPTVVVTTMIYDFASDDDLFKRGLTGNARRNRRFGGFVFMLVGAIVGGFVTHATGHIVNSLWTGCAIKAAITFAWIVWPTQR